MLQNTVKIHDKKCLDTSVFEIVGTFLVIFKHSVTVFIIQECIFEIAVAVVSKVRSEGNMKNTFDKIH